MKRKIIFLMFLLGATILFAPRAAFAAGVVGNGTPASCTTAALDNALSGGGLVTFNCGAGVVTIVMTGNRRITADTTINGGNRIELVPSTSRHFRVRKNVTLKLQNITLKNATSNSGAIENSGTLILRKVTLRDNTSSNYGGAINNHGTLKINRSTFLQNTAQHHGGAIYSDGNTVTIKASTFSGNHAINGGGVYTDLDTGKITVTRSTFYNNSASYAGAGMYTNATAEIVNSTFTGNSSQFASGFHRERGDATVRHVTFGTNPSQYGAGFSSQTSNGTLYVQNSVFASTGYNCNVGIYVSLGNNVSSDALCSFLTASGDMQNTDAKLGALANNGGPTLTHLPSNDSPLINNGAEAGVTIDQRGMSRPVGNADIGAVEVQ